MILPPGGRPPLGTVSSTRGSPGDVPCEGRRPPRAALTAKGVWNLAKQSILAALSEAGPTDLEEVRSKIEEGEKELAALRQLEKVLDYKFNGKPPKAPPGTGKKSKMPRGALTDKYRRDAALLLLKGPRRAAEIAEECGIPTGSITSVLDHPWFGRNGSGEVHVTTEGRRQVA